MVITLSEAINRLNRRIFGVAGGVHASTSFAEAMMELFLSASWWEWAMIIVNDVCLYDQFKPWLTFAYDVVFLI